MSVWSLQVTMKSLFLISNNQSSTSNQNVQIIVFIVFALQYNYSGS